MAGSSHASDAGGYVRRSMGEGAEARHYLLRLPPGERAPRPLVILLHGHSGSAARLVGERARAAPYRRWIEIAERERLILAAPDGAKGSDNQQGWNDCRGDARTNPATDDVAFLEDMINDIQREWPVDRQRIFVVGTSNGGNMALRMAIERPDLVAGVAAVVAAMPAQSKCTPPQRAVPVLIMNGTGDPLLPFGGGTVGGKGSSRGSVLSTQESVEVWRRLAGARGAVELYSFPDRDTKDESRVERASTANVVLYRIVGGGHTEPSIRERYPRLIQRLLGPQNGDIEMADEVWRFFSARANGRRVVR